MYYNNVTRKHYYKGDIYMQRLDLTGKKFGHLTAIEFAGGKKNGNRTRSKWLCRCDCGKEILVITDNLTRDHSKSCGCEKGGMVTASKITHGKSHDPIYPLWNAMRSRCYNKNHKDYDIYGGRGIAVCERWQKFENFYEDMGDMPSKNHSLDRIDSNGNYEKDNCKWSTASEQRNNQRRTKLYGPEGDKHCIKYWCDLKNIPYARLAQRLEKLGWSFERAISTVDGRRKKET